MIGKGYSINATILELNMVAEGYHASRCMNHINESIQSEMPIADAIYKILWKQESPKNGFRAIESILV